jgi:hypothetical protein
VNKSNVIKLKKSNVVGAILPESQCIGWLIYRPDSDEFFYSHKACPGYSGNVFVKEPAIAYCFDSERLAFNYSVHIEQSTQIVPLYDTGENLFVAFQ